MPPALIAIAAAAATVAVKIFVSSAILAAILTVAISVAASALIAKSQAKKVNQGTELSLKLDATYSREFPVGTTATGGSVNWAFTYTNDSKKPNRYLVRIIALSDLPVDGVIEVRSGDAVLSFTGDITTGLRACNQHLSKAGSPMLYIRVYKGSSAAVADSDLISWSGGQWTASHKGTNMCYAIVRSDYDADAFPNGEAQLRFTLRGVKIYDDRLDGSKPSRSGAHRLATPSTWEYSENTANIIAQLLRGFESNGVLIAGAQAEERDLSDSMLLSAYNTCDQLVSEGAGAGTIKRYASGMMVRSSDATASSLVELQSSMDGAVRDRGGAITILPGAVRTPVFHLTDTDVIWTEERSWQPQSSLSDLQNHFIGTFVDGLNGYTEKDFPPYKNAAWEVDDGGERFSTQVSFRAVTHWSRAQRIIKRMAASSRLQGTVAFVLPLLKGLQLEQGDWFTMTSARWGFTTKYFEVVKADISSDLKVAIVAKETASSLDGWSSVVDEVGRSDTTWNPPTWAIPAPDLAAAAFYYKDPISGHEDCGVTLTLTNFPSMQGITGIEVEAALQSALGSPWKITTLAPSNQVYTYIGLSPSIAYAVRIRTSDGLRQGDWSSWVNFTTAAFVGGTLDAGDNLLTNAAMTLDSSGWTAAVNCVRTTPTTNDPAAFWRSTAGTDPEVYANSQMTRPLNGATRLFASLSVRANDITSSGKIVVKFYKNGVFDQTLDAMTALLPTTANTWIRGDRKSVV